MDHYETIKQCDSVSDHRIGQRAISHDGHSHPGGPQICLVCGKTLSEIVATEKDFQLNQLIGYVEGMREDGVHDLRQVLSEIRSLLSG